jgi:hypothetical protein
MRLAQLLGAVILFALVGAGAWVSAGENAQAMWVDFPHIRLKPGQSFSTVRIVVTCGHIVAVSYTPDDWYVSTQRTQGSLDPKSPEFIHGAVMIEFSAGHGVSRMTDASKFNGSVRVLADVPSCFKVAATVEDDMTDDWPKLEIEGAQLRLRK